MATRKRKVSFWATKSVRSKVSFRSKSGKKVSFMAKRPKKVRVSFHTKKSK